MKIIWKFEILESLNPDLLLFWHFCRKMKVDNTVSKQLTKLKKEAFHSLFSKVLKICKSSRWCFSTFSATFNCLCAVWAQRILSILSLSLTFSLFALRLGCPGHWAAEGTVMPSTLSLSETLTQPGPWSAQQLRGRPGRFRNFPSVSGLSVFVLQTLITPIGGRLGFFSFGYRVTELRLTVPAQV